MPSETILLRGSQMHAGKHEGCVPFLNLQVDRACLHRVLGCSRLHIPATP